MVLEDIDADDAELVEIDENLIRAELTPTETAMHVGRRKELYEKLHPETKQGAAPGAGKGKQSSQVENLPFVINTARKTRKGRSTVAKAVTRSKKVKVLPDITGTSLDKGSELDALAKLPEAEQRELAGRAKAGEKVSARRHRTRPLDRLVDSHAKAISKSADGLEEEQLPSFFRLLHVAIDAVERGN